MFEKLPRLEWLLIDGNPKLVGDIAVFEKLPQLEGLIIRGNPKLEGDIEALKRALPNCWIAS